jgi:transketolase
MQSDRDVRGSLPVAPGLDRAAPGSGAQLSPRLTDAERNHLGEMAYRVRRLTIESVTAARWGHIAGALSMADILAVLYWRELNVDPSMPSWEQRDRLVLSKAHASPSLYAVLALKGFYPVEELYHYTDMDGILEGHADMTKTPGLENSGGLLGLGLSVAQGMALALRMKDAQRPRVYCIMGDGEMHEGNIWEAAMSAAQFGLDNLIGILDYNRIMSKGFLHDWMSIEPIADKWRSFGWDVLEVDGHDIDDLAGSLYRARWVVPRGRPVLVIAHTVKGRGRTAAENSYRWHTHYPSPELADEMLRDLARNYGRPEEGYSRLGAPVTNEAFHV